MTLDISVAKFGGTSVAKHTQKMLEIFTDISEEVYRKIIVVSAPGKRHDTDVKVTDRLVHLAREQSAELAEEIYQHFAQCSNKGNSVLEKIMRLCQ